MDSVEVNVYNQVNSGGEKIPVTIVGVLLTAAVVLVFWREMLLIGSIVAVAAYSLKAAANRAAGRDGLRRRADEQHAMVMRGDERGIYGAYF